MLTDDWNSAALKESFTCQPYLSIRGVRLEAEQRGIVLTGVRRYPRLSEQCIEAKISLPALDPRDVCSMESAILCEFNLRPLF
jgi:hypothetical protein